MQPAPERFHMTLHYKQGPLTTSTLNTATDFYAKTH
jgi:hypothetical protein